jgi:exopolyphosphatase/pppGpp-phosphohydrolase
MTVNRQKALAAVVALAERCHYEEGHTRQVTRLALRLFDELHGLHGLGATERFWLECAGLLHDIGWIDGQQGHHKTALRLILGDSSLPFDDRVRGIVASIARYHRGAVPSKKHEHYAALRPSDRRTVSVLAGILRVADGLDRTHENVVADLTCEVVANRIRLRCVTDGPAEAEVKAALKKADLFQDAFGKALEIETNLHS